MVALVLLPGLDGSGMLFESFAAALGSDVDITTIPYPPDQALGYSELEQLVTASLPTGQPFYLLAESFSGPLALSIAATPPVGLRGVILCCSFARAPLPLSHLFKGLTRLVPLGLLPEALLDFLLLGRFSNAQLRQALARAQKGVKPAVLKRRALAALSVDVSGVLPAFSLPLLYLRASEDRLIGRGNSSLLKTLQPATQIVELVAPHFLLQVVPEAAAAVVKRFIAAQKNKAQ